MCKYCCDKEKIEYKYDNLNIDTICINNNSLQIESSRCMGDRSSEVVIDINIKYCPFCNKKLS